MTLEQERAANAFRDITSLKLDDKQKKRYGVMAIKLTALIRTAGLCQAVHFIKSRNNPTYDLLLGHVALQLQRRNENITNAKSLCEEVRGADVQQYLHLTREALAVANWYGRLAQSELKVKPTDEVEEDDES